MLGNSPYVVLLEDDVVLSKEIRDYLISVNIMCDCVYDGSLLLKQVKREEYDIAILDVNVPGINGLEVCKQLRSADSKIPILMLTAFGEIDDKVLAFNNGADDYLVKPFHFDELIVRIKALLRRRETPQQADEVLSVGRLIIDVANSIVLDGSKEVKLTPKEFKLLVLLVRAKGRVLSKNFIADELWDYNIETNQNSIEVYINFLRKKIDKDAQEKLIHTKVGFGYYVKAENRDTQE